jgi:hypothetical protein
MGLGIDHLSNVAIRLQAQTTLAIPKEEHRLLLPPKHLNHHVGESPAAGLFLPHSLVVGRPEPMDVSTTRYQLNSDIDVAEPLSGLQVAAEDDCAAHPRQKAIIGVQELDSFEKFGKQAIGSRAMQRLGRRSAPEANTFVGEAPLPSAARDPARRRTGSIKPAVRRPVTKRCACCFVNSSCCPTKSNVRVLLRPALLNMLRIRVNGMPSICSLDSIHIRRYRPT